MTEGFNAVHELDRAIDFGFALLEASPPLPPSVAGFKDRDRLFIGCRPFEPDRDPEQEKDGSFAMMATAVRYWGAGHLIVMADSHIRKMDEGETLQVMPSQDPRSTDALVAYHFDRSGPRSMVTVQYHLDDGGQLVRDERSFDDDIASDSYGRIPALFGAAMTMPDGQLDAMMASAPGGGVHHPLDLFMYMSKMGFTIFEGTREGTKVYVTDPDELGQLIEMLKEEGWSQGENA